LGSDDVNDYLREITGEDITTKDFRTWAATNLAALALRDFDAYDSAAKGKKNVLRAIEPVAKMLGNTRSICRKCFIHPAIIEGYLDTILEGINDHADEILDDKASGLTAKELAVVAYLDRRLSTPSP
jgi:DNA topoisomerase-1